MNLWAIYYDGIQYGPAMGQKLAYEKYRRLRAYVKNLDLRLLTDQGLKAVGK